MSGTGTRRRGYAPAGRGNRGGGRTRLTRRGRVLAWGAGVISLVVLGVGGAGAWIYQDLNDNIDRARVDDKLGTDRPVNLSPGSKNIMLVGSDSRDGDNAEYGKGLTTMQSDTLMVLHIPANRKWASVVSFPRDSWVEIPACEKGDGTSSSTHHAKINEAFAIGGLSGEVSGAAACSIKTLEANTGLRIDNFMSIDFSGFKGMVDALDGIEVCPEAAIHDKKARLDLEAGCQTFKGEKALGYVRTRYSVGDGSDIGRIGRQQEFMESLVKKAKSKLTSADAMYGFLKSFTDSLTADPDLAGLQQLYGLADELKDIPSERLNFFTVPNYGRVADVPSDTANVVWQYPQAADVFTSLAKDQEVTKAEVQAAKKDVVYASSVKVQVLNGTGVGGRAAAVGERLTKAGYSLAGTGNASGTAAKTTVAYPAGLERQAAALASRVPGVEPVEDASATPGVVTLTVGTDLEVDDVA